MPRLPISVVITCYNNKKTILSAARSVLDQVPGVTEVIVADDCSQDGSREAILGLARENPIVRPVLREWNLGIAANRDLAIRDAASPFVTHLDGDDLIGPRKIAAEWRAIDGHKDRVA